MPRETYNILQRDLYVSAFFRVFAVCATTRASRQPHGLVRNLTVHPIESGPHTTGMVPTSTRETSHFARSLLLRIYAHINLERKERPTKAWLIDRGT
jgi:hypothetical protein